MNIKKLVVIACGVLFSFSVALALSSGSITRYAVAAPSSAGNTYVVNSTDDEPDVDPSNGICFSTPSGRCTLRAAIMDANYATGPNTITLPAGVYVLTRPGYDDNALVGDLDIGHDMTIQGAGSGVTIIDGNGAVTGDRVFQILNTAQNVTPISCRWRGGVRARSRHCCARRMGSGSAGDPYQPPVRTAVHSARDHGAEAADREARETPRRG